MSQHEEQQHQQQHQQQQPSPEAQVCAALRDFLGTEDVSRFNPFLCALAREYYVTVEDLRTAKREGLSKAGLPSALVDKILDKQAASTQPGSGNGRTAAGGGATGATGASTSGLGGGGGAQEQGDVTITVHNHDIRIPARIRGGRLQERQVVLALKAHHMVPTLINGTVPPVDEGGYYDLPLLTDGAEVVVTVAPETPADVTSSWKKSARNCAVALISALAVAGVTWLGTYLTTTFPGASSDAPAQGNTTST